MTNVTAFGAFVDVGVHRDGLVHVSELSDNFVKDPGQVVKVHQKVMVTVLDIDLERGRVSLSMKSTPTPAAGKTEKETPGSAKTRHAKEPQIKKKGGFNNPFEQAFNTGLRPKK